MTSVREGVEVEPAPCGQCGKMTVSRIESPDGKVGCLACFMGFLSGGPPALDAKVQGVVETQETHLHVTQGQFEKLVRIRKGVCTCCWNWASPVDKDETEIECVECHEHCVKGASRARDDGNIVIVETEEESDW